MATLSTMTHAVTRLIPPPPIAIYPPRDMESWQCLRAITHSLESMDGIPYYDEEFNMAQSDAHRHTIYRLGNLWDYVAKLAGLRGVSDYPIWYWITEENRQKELYPDYAISANLDIKALRSSDLLLVLEVVSTAQVAKELKDTVRMKRYNANNKVQEFVLLYPELNDTRSMEWFRLDVVSGDYQLLALPTDRRYRSAAIPGLEIEVLNSSDWQFGKKVRVWYRGELLLDREEETQARIAESKARKEAEKARKEAEKARKEAEKALKEAEKTQKEAEKALKKEEKVRKEAEKARKEAEKAQKKEEKARKEAEKAQKEEEKARTEADTARKKAEKVRSEAEKARIAAELMTEKAEQVAEQEHQARIAAESVVEQERQARVTVEAENTRLRELLKQLGACN